MGHKGKHTLKDALNDCFQAYVSAPDESGVNPICKVDGLIFLEIHILVKKLGGDKNLIRILNGYKSINDEETLELLMSYNNSFEGKLENVKIFIEIGNFSGNINGIFSFSKQDSYDTKVHRNKYLLIINKTVDQKLPYANLEIEFNSKEQREEEILRLKNKLKQFTNIMFL